MQCSPRVAPHWQPSKSKISSNALSFLLSERHFPPFFSLSCLLSFEVSSLTFDRSHRDSSVSWLIYTHAGALPSEAIETIIYDRSSAPAFHGENFLLLLMSFLVPPLELKFYNMPPSASTSHSLAKSLVNPSLRIRSTSSAVVE